MTAARATGALRVGLVFAFLVSAATRMTAGVNSWTSHGPYGGQVVALAADPQHAGTVYAAFPSYGVFKTTDGAVTWSDASGGMNPDPQHREVVALALDPGNTSNVYAALNEDGVWKSADGGGSWSSLGLDLTTGIAAVGVSVDPRNSLVLDVAMAFGFAKSVDGGVTWQVGPGLPGVVVRNLTMDTAHPDVLYALATGATPIFRSLDGGATWQAVPTSFDLSGIDVISVDPASSRVYAASGAGVLFSDDQGGHWQEALDGHFTNVSVVRPSEIFAASAYDSTIQESTDAGAHWVSRSTPVSMYLGNFVADPRAGIVYAPSAFNGVIRSVDEGASWTLANVGQSGLEMSVASDPHNPSLVYAASGGGFFRSDDGGGTWTAVDLASQAYLVALEPDSGTLYSSRGRSFDGGVLWTPLPFLADSIQPPTIVPSPPHTLFIGTCVDSSTARILTSSDKGATWTTVFDSKQGGCVNSIVASPSGVDLYASISAFGGGSVLQSIDGGLTWHPTSSSGFPPNPGPLVLAVDPNHSNVIYATENDQLWVSEDGGGVWSNISPDTTGFYTIPPATQLVVDPTNSSNLYAAMMGGVFRSADRGATWQPLGDGLPTTPIQSLTLDATGKFLHAGTLQGVYVYQISENCDGGPSTLCLYHARFHATLTAADPSSGEQTTGVAVSQADDWGFFSLPTLTGNAALPEVAVKLADGRPITGTFWLYYGALTTLKYSLTVVDTLTDRQAVYESAELDATHPCGGGDGSTFVDDPAAMKSASAADDTSVTLLSHFQVSVLPFNNADGTPAVITGFSSDPHWGYFRLPDYSDTSTAPHVLVKMVDATALPEGGYWFFFTGFTVLPYTLQVTDTVTGTQKQYGNPQPLCGQTDTTTFHD